MGRAPPLPQKGGQWGRKGGGGGARRAELNKGKGAMAAPSAKLLATWVRAIGNSGELAKKKKPLCLRAG